MQVTTPDRDRLVELALKLSEHAEGQLEAEGLHIPMCVLWPRNGRKGPVARGLDDSRPEAFAGWAADVANLAVEADATTVVMIMEGWGAKPPGAWSEAQAVLIVAALNALGDEVIIETPTVSDDQGRRHVKGPRSIRTAGQQLSFFEPLRAFWARSFARRPSA